MKFHVCGVAREDGYAASGPAVAVTEWLLTQHTAMEKISNEIASEMGFMPCSCVGLAFIMSYLSQ